MFCYNCGTQVSDDCKFCSNCGAQLNNVPSSPILNSKVINIRQIKPDTNTIINIVICVIMILTMLTLPMFELNYDTDYKNKVYTISLLGDNYMAAHSIRDGIVTFSRVAFVFMLASIIAVIVFKFVQKTRFSLIASVTNLGILLIYDLYVHTTWMAQASKFDDYATIIGAGNVICIGCAVALVFLSFRASKRKIAE